MGVTNDHGGNMNLLEIMKERKSTREFSNRALSEADQQKVSELLKGPFNVTGHEMVEMRVLNEGRDVFEALKGRAGYSGVMIEAPQYIAFLADRTEDAYQAVGFMGEAILFNLFVEEIGSCWISIDDKDEAKAALGMDSKKELAALIAIGYPQGENFIAKFFQNFKANKSSPISEGGYGNYKVEYRADGNEYSGREATRNFVYLDYFGNETDLDELEERGLDEAFYYIKQAPSWANRQPWRYILRGYELIMAVEHNPKNSHEMDMLEAGIAMYYVNLVFNEIGISGTWVSKPVEENLRIPSDFFLAGHYEINR